MFAPAWPVYCTSTALGRVPLVGLLFVSLSLHVEILFKPEHQDFRELAARAFEGCRYGMITALPFLLPADNGLILAYMDALITPVVRMLAASRRTSWDLPSYVGRVRAGQPVQ